MPRKSVIHEDDYAVAGGVVRLSVVVGEKQFGTSMVFLDDEAIANGVIKNLEIGSGPDLAGSTVEIYTMVTDISSATDEMEVSWTLTGGKKKLAAGEHASPPADFGSQMFKGIFHFTAGKSKGKS
jgi:hypothetical protein